MESHPSQAKPPTRRNGKNEKKIPLVVCFLAGAMFPICFPSHVLTGQAITAPPRPTSILLPEANRPPDANEKMMMNQAHQKKENFDAANARRQQQITDESAKLLILAKDLKAQMDKLGDKPLPDRLLREAEVIELLAHDVQTKMTLTVSGG